MLINHRSVYLLPLILISTLDSIISEDLSSIGSSLSSDQQMIFDHEIGSDGKPWIGLNHFLDYPRLTLPLSSSSSSSPLSLPSSTGSQLINHNHNSNNRFTNQGTNSYPLNSIEDNQMIDWLISLPEKKSSSLVRDQGKSDLPVYHHHYHLQHHPVYQFPHLPELYSSHYDNGYRKKAAFTGMRGKKLLYFPLSSLINSPYSGIESEQIITKRSRPFLAMRDKRALRRGRARFYASRG
ncbi:uncharacterized protein LOC128386767 isoform X2 [Panonychus citri]|uniref:uncharacterized protein LOC128386767 isoform X2 n=1 Tax=Panonychus citri TaxID=50023 RepID=UPI002307FCF0|nr:uncharacterized protein LOC128386767 isoform X2 [Panonychus citri]